MKPDIVDLINFLASYADTLISVGSHNARVKRCVKRVAQSFGYDVSIFVLLKTITITVAQIDDYKNRRTIVKETTAHSVNLGMVSELSALSWAVKDENLSFDETRKIYEIILKSKDPKFTLSVVVTSAAFGAFCKLFGGDVWAIVFVVCGTILGVSLRYFLQKQKFDLRVTYIICAFLSSFVAYLSFNFGLSNTPEAAISSSILYLFPGIVLLNSMFDILDKNVLVGVSRAVNATILIICMSIGIYITLTIAHMVSL